MPATSPSTRYGATTIEQSRSSSIGFSEPMRHGGALVEQVADQRHDLDLVLEQLEQPGRARRSWGTPPARRRAGWRRRRRAARRLSCSRARRRARRALRARACRPRGPATGRSSGSATQRDADELRVEQRAGGRDRWRRRRRRRGGGRTSRRCRSTGSRARARATAGGVTSWTLRTVADVDVCGPTTTAVCVLTRARSWLVSWSRSSSTWCADAKSVKKSETARRCAGASAGLPREVVDEEAVAAVGGDPPGRRVRLRRGSPRARGRSSRCAPWRSTRRGRASARSSASRPAGRSRCAPPRWPGGSPPCARRAPLALDSTECQRARSAARGRPGAAR